MKKQKVLIVDDMPENISLLVEALKDDYAVIATTLGKKALQMANLDPIPDLILLDINMPSMDGYEVFEKLRENKKTRHISVIFITALNDDESEELGLELGAVDYIRKPFNTRLVKNRVHNHLELKKYRDQLEEIVDHRTEEVIHLQDALLGSMGSLAEYRDPETGGHIKRTQHYIKLLAESMKDHPPFTGLLDKQMIEILFKVAPLHDIGKVGVPDHILLKPDKLTHSEFSEMKKHVNYGTAVVKDIESTVGKEPLSHVAIQIIDGHHEKWDGSGYPRGLRGKQISIPGRLMAIVDVYDALISKRVYKSPMPHPHAVQIIREGRGTHFDPDITDAFLAKENEIKQVALKFADFDEERKMLSV
ncbi:HD-GYP domain-containing protein [Pseudomonadota bacterium]